MSRQVFVCLLTLFVALTANAYVIGSHFIFDRTVQQHGKGTYIIDQEVTFHDGADTMTVKENWLVVDGGEMRVLAQGPGFKTFRLLKKKRIFWTEAGSEKADEMTDDYFMAPLLTRSAAEEKRFFIRWNILPPDVLREKKAVKDVKLVKNETEPFMRLARTAGTVAYTFGEPAALDGPLPPGLWIEQDEFVIRKMRSPDGAEFTGNDYVPFSKNLWYPKTQTVSFGNHQATVRVTNVTSADFSSEQKKQFDPTWVRSRSEIATIWPKSSLAGQVQEFYKRFR